MNDTERLVEQRWTEFDHDTPESFWDVAVWRDNGWVRGSLDVADRKRIGLALLAAVVRAAPSEATTATEPQRRTT